MNTTNNTIENGRVSNPEACAEEFVEVIVPLGSAVDGAVGRKILVSHAFLEKQGIQLAQLAPNLAGSGKQLPTVGYGK